MSRGGGPILPQDLGWADPRTGSPGPFGPGTPEESEKSPEESRSGTRRVRKECAPESQKGPKESKT